MSSSSAAILTVTGVGRRYRSRWALADVSFNLDPGTICGLLGPNGAGKTTCLHIITGLLEPTAGDVYVLGESVRHKYTRKSIGFAPDDLPLPSALTGHEYIQFHDRLRHRDDRDRADSLAQALGIADDLSRQISEYSHGMKRKLQIIAATMHKPALLVLDEPFRGLDPEAAAVLHELLETFVVAGSSVLLATHDLLRAERDCDEAIIINDGLVVESGPPAQLRAKFEADNLEEVFLQATGLAPGREHRYELLQHAFANSE